MGTGHAASGMAVWLALTSPAPVGFGVLDLELPAVISGAVICAGAALLPDADHPNATIAHSVPGLGSVAAGAVGAASGGHRHGMHSLLAIVGCWLLFWWMGTVTVQTGWSVVPELSVGGIVAGVALTTFAYKVLRIAKSWIRAWLMGMVSGLILAAFLPGADLWLPLCVTIGYGVHLAGDLLTVQGVPLLWPLPIKPPKALHSVPVVNRIWMKNGYFALPVLGTAGSMRETVLLFAMTLYIMAAIAHPLADAAGMLA